MTSKELPDKITSIEPNGLRNSLLLKLNVNPTRCSVELKLAHIHLETGNIARERMLNWSR